MIVVCDLEATLLSPITESVESKEDLGNLGRVLLGLFLLAQCYLVLPLLVESK